MPSVSQAQNAAMHAAAEGRSTLGIPANVGRKFVMADAGSAVGELPERVGEPPHPMHHLAKLLKHLNTMPK